MHTLLVDPAMHTLLVDPAASLGPVKPLNAVNNGPVVARAEQTRGNFDAYRALEIPFARTHDASFFPGYGGEHTVDVHAIFPRFEADPEDPASYDFAPTDRYLAQIAAAGTEPFFRLGSKIEHEPEKYGTRVPPDFRKWAVVCEHIVRHVNEGWAGGTRLGVRYWEIWAEPDLNGDDDPPEEKKCWGGTRAQFFELFRTAALHLKSRFPGIRVGGPGVAWNREFAASLVAFLATGGPGGSRVPLDFLSWHHYAANPAHLAARARQYRAILDAAGYARTESILDEFNYVRDWSEHWLDSIAAINGAQGAAFAAYAMASLAEEPVDLLAYYDARPCEMNGLFDFYTLRPRKTWHVYRAFARLRALGTAVHAEAGGDPALAVCAARGADGRLAALVSHFAERGEEAAPKRFALRLASGAWAGAAVRVLDAARDFAPVAAAPAGADLPVELPPNAVAFVEARHVTAP